MVTRVSTGVKELDKLVEGGLPKGSVVLYSGAPGAGKSILTMQYLEDGIKKGETCVYVEIEEQPQKILEQASQFGMFKKPPVILSATSLLKGISEEGIDDTIEARIKYVLKKLDDLKPDRIVLDSVTSLTIEDGLEARRLVRLLIEGLAKNNATCIVTGESLDGDYPDKVTPFLVDGVILLSHLVVGSSAGRSLFIQKLRETKHSEEVHPFEIGKKGIVLKPVEESYKI